MDAKLISVLVGAAFVYAAVRMALAEDRETAQAEAREHARQEAFYRFLSDARRYLSR